MDFSVMNDTVSAAFAETVTVEGLGDVQAIYDSRHYADQSGEQGGSTLVTSIAVTDDIAASVTVEDTTITARGIDYVASDKRPDGEGFTTIELWRKP